VSRASDIKARAQAFADDIALLLNRTVSSHVRLSAYDGEGKGVIYIGTADGGRLAKMAPIPLLTGKAFARLWLDLGYTVLFDPDGKFMVKSSIFGLKTGVNAEHEIFRVDYEREKQKYPASHIQVIGSNDALRSLFQAMGIPKQRLEDLHFPCGGKRYRPIIEDVVEFVITEGLVGKSAEDSQAILKLLANRRADFQRVQLAAAIRGDIETTIGALDELGYDVKRRPATRGRPGKTRSAMRTLLRVAPDPRRESDPIEADQSAD
jgi:hypothetical protein